MTISSLLTAHPFQSHARRCGIDAAGAGVPTRGHEERKVHECDDEDDGGAECDDDACAVDDGGDVGCLGRCAVGGGFADVGGGGGG